MAHVWDNPDEFALDLYGWVSSGIIVWLSEALFSCYGKDCTATLKKCKIMIPVAAWVLI